ncbi:glycosyltransferase [Tropicimonas sp. S265A]|uniref:glycosyltransferase n=1 Tax=Tropicimonas sp. S265A TaxID=3415134 RepID=UPI003C7C40F6
MPAPLSIVMPVLNAAPGLARSLPALAEGLENGVISQLILSDGGSTDETKRVADAAGAVWLTGAPGRGGQVARGIAAAHCPWILVLHADTVLSPGWSLAVAEAFATPDIARYGTLSFDARGPAPRIVARWANLRSRVFGLPYGDQALLVHQTLLEKVGGYPDLPLMEDVALSRALKGRLAPLGVVARTSADRYQREGWLWRGVRNLSLLARFFAGADPAQLAAAYSGRSRPPQD